MSANGLESVPDLREPHRKALAGIGITTLGGLADADPKALREALRASRVKRATIDEWQAYARKRAGSDWESVASYAVIFEQRLIADGLERRITVAQTELEHEEEPASLDGWRSEQLGAWFEGRFPVSVPPTHADDAPTQAREGDGPPALRIEAVRLVEGDEPTDVFPTTGDEPPLLACTKEGRIEVDVSGAGPEDEVQVALQVRRLEGESAEGQPRLWHTASAGARKQGRATLDLSRIGGGRREGKLVAWTPAGTARSVTLRALDIVRS